MPKARMPSDEEMLTRLALVLVETGLRGSRLEELHAGVSPSSGIGDYSDVKVVTPYGEIAWSRLSRLDDEEMKALMIEVVDRVYTILNYPDAFSRLLAAGRWNKPKLSPALMDAVHRWEARQRGVAEAEIWAAWPLDEAKQLAPSVASSARRPMRLTATSRARPGRLRPRPGQCGAWPRRPWSMRPGSPRRARRCAWEPMPGKATGSKRSTGSRRRVPFATDVTT